MSAQPTPTNAATPGLAQNARNQSIKSFAAALSSAAAVFGIQIFFFLLLSGNWRIKKASKDGKTPTEKQNILHKIYFYKTAFVSKTKRIKEPVTAIESFKNVFTISDRELIRVAGVDGYLFVQYLQMLLKIFIPMALVILPILLPINRAGNVGGVSGLDSFAWSNAAAPWKVRRLWAHLVVAICVVVWVCYNFYLAMRKFVRLRQTILTMPEHRIRASATTILVQSIPRKWLTVAALEALYDVFPGGIREIWINRNYDELQEKINIRTKIARTLEQAESELIIKCTKKHKELEEKKRKQAGVKISKQEKKHDVEQENQHIALTGEAGTSSGNPHQIEQALQEVLVDNSSDSSSSSSSSRSSSPEAERKWAKIPIPLVGDGIEAIGDGIRDVGHGVGKIGSRFVGGMRGAFGSKHGRGPAPAQLDGPDERPIASPVSSDFEPRGVSSDTYAPLNMTTLEKEKMADEDGSTLPNSPQEVPRLEPPAKMDKTSRTDPLEAIKKSHLNPLRRMSDFASPQPFHAEGEEFPLESEIPKEPVAYDYTGVRNEEYAEDDETALWRKYIEPKDRDTMRIPLLNKSWWPSLPLIGKKVDTIYYCRKELARLNFEIADDQAHPERFPLMNSAFIQFNHQVAAHMACQSLSHHIPRQMAPRTVEVNPNYVMWDNMTMKWWERYLRMGLVIAAIVGLIIFWGIPVSFTGAISQIDNLVALVKWLSWIKKLPIWLISFIQGVLPPVLLGILLAVLPLILRFLAGLTGTSTTGERELLVQNFYFAFVFIQLFLVVSISTSITNTIDDVLHNPISIPETLAKNLPKASNYFFSYMILQAFSISSGTLLQIVSVVMLVLFRWFDKTPRQKVARILSRPGINWGNMIPVYTNLAAIGLVYSVIAPLIIIMMLITFTLFWFTYRYQMIYVSYAVAETNGLIFPKAINQLFTGLYFLELCLIGLFFLVQDGKGHQACFPQAIIMIVVLGFTALYQIILNKAFGPLFTYLPITFEDEAVQRDEEFQRAQASRWQKDDDEHRSLNSQVEAQEKQERRESQLLEAQDRGSSTKYRDEQEIELKKLESIHGRDDLTLQPTDSSPGRGKKGQSWADKSRSRSRSQSHQRHGRGRRSKSIKPLNALTSALRSGFDTAARPIRDIEAQTNPTGYLFDDIEDSLEDINPEARQKLIKRAFQHPATRAIQPAIWIPHDQLGVASDEIQRTSRYSNKIWITSVNANLDAQGDVYYRGLPPDRDPFENIEV